MHTKTISSRIFLWLPFLFLCIFLIDFFFTVPNADDYDFFLRIKDFGFFGFQKFMYLHQNGRFVASFFVACYSGLFNIIKVYWIFCFLFFGLLYFSLFFFVNAFFGCLSIKSKVLNRCSYAAWLMLLFIAVCAELSSFIFWMPGVVTYQLPISFLFFAAGFLMQAVSQKNTFFLVTGLCFIALASGCQELIFLLAAPPLLVLSAINFKNKLLRTTFFFIFLSLLIPFLLSFYSPGTSARQTAAAVAPVSLSAIISGSVLREIFLFAHLLTTGYLYVVLIVVYFIAGANRQKLNLYLKGFPLYIMVLITVFQPFFIYSVTLKSFNSGLPERADNLLLIWATFFLLLIVIKSGSNKSAQYLFDKMPYQKKIFLSLLTALCICSSNINDGVKAIIAGYFYKQITAERLTEVRLKNGVRTLSLTNYADELSLYYRKKYGTQMPSKLFNVAKRNDIILFRDVYDLLIGQNNSFRIYNKIDTIKTPAAIGYKDTLIYLPQVKNGF